MDGISTCLDGYGRITWMGTGWLFLVLKIDSHKIIEPRKYGVFFLDIVSISSSNLSHCSSSQTYALWKNGISNKTIEKTLNNSKFLPKVIEYDRYQPEFYEDTFTYIKKRVTNSKIKKGIYYLKHGDYEYPITLQLINDGRKNKVLNKKTNLKINVTMIHGQKDEVVPVSYSRKILKIFKKAKKKLVIIKNGDHSLSKKKYLKIILKELKLII